jgi:hypothetical protein
LPSLKLGTHSNKAGMAFPSWVGNGIFYVRFIS